MADIQKANTAYIRKWEGGASSDPRDPASHDPCPGWFLGKYPVHTNMGITWASFKANCPAFGYKPTKELFQKMPDEVWRSIYEHGYWAAVRAGEIPSQAIGEFMADWGWGSGPGTAVGYLQKAIRKYYTPSQPVTQMFGPVTMGNLTSWIKVKGGYEVFQKLYADRTAFLASLPQYKIYGPGWMNRMRDFKAYAESILKK